MPKKISNEEFYQDLIEVDDFIKNDNSSDQLCPILESIHSCTQRYENNQSIDCGGSKKISSVLDNMTSRQIALAELINTDDPELSERFFSEIFLTSSLEHPNIIPVYDAGLNEERKPFFTMKLVEGENLEQLMKKHPEDFSLQQAIDIFLKICDAIEYAHSKNIIHLDIKPANIRMGKYGEVLVCDWGIAKILTDDDEHEQDPSSLDPNIINDVTLDGFIKGSPGYLAPEQIDSSLGNKDFQSDIYALGGILYFLLSFHPPHAHDDVNECLQQTLNEPVTELSEVRNPQFRIPPSLAAVAMKALNKNKALRYESVKELRREILKWREGFATGAENASFLILTSLLFKRHKVLTSLSLSFLFICLIFIYQLKLSEGNALEQKILAESNALLAMKNEEKAIEALRLYKQEKIVASMASIEAAPALYEKALSLMRTGEFNKSHEQILLTIKRDKNYTPAKVLLAELYFIRQEYKKAYDYIKLENLQPYTSHFFKTLEKFKDSSALNEKSLFELTDDLNYIELEQMLCLYFIQNSDSNELKKIILKRLIKRSNRLINESEISINYDGSKLNIDLSKTQKTRYLIALNGLEINKLNLNNTNILHSSEFKYIRAREINLENTNIDLFHDILYLPKLKKVTISKGAYNYLNYADFPHLIIEFK
ncbi:serine/threonine-protein kinase [Lentisphaera profundi]|uniref:Serine/threonine-protein kinase n=1 Tax=Lentisphaera profundi TaxID=1658616 RepID=A0ABY7VWL3_9BACT|nr:serine/threonine-protein kinase [Lentisphaera profundi]WDE98613.1 serine/threonine-protein kinase [Lentisphaera profundi]